LLLAFDFGLRRIGVASGDVFSGLATPRPPVLVPASGIPWDQVLDTVRRHGPDLLLVGAPYNDDGTPARIAAAADGFAAGLATRSGLPVARVDERFSSVEAASLLKDQRAAGQHRRLRRGDVDSGAAAVILGSWLRQQDSRNRTA
jgi:putative Holliday junction resolvase